MIDEYVGIKKIMIMNFFLIINYYFFITNKNTINIIKVDKSEIKRNIKPKGKGNYLFLINTQQNVNKN